MFLQSLDYYDHHQRLFLLIIFLTGVVLLSSSGDDSNSFYWQSSSALLGAAAIALPGAVNAFEQDLAFVTVRRTSSSSSSSSYLNRPYQLRSLRKDDCDSSPELSSGTTASRSLGKTKQRHRQRKRRRQPELWLDLRNMAIHPKAAIDYIGDKLVVGGDDNSDSDTSTSSGTSSLFLPDRILLSQIVFQNLVDHSDLYLTCEPEILYQKNADYRSSHNNNNNNGGDVDVSINDDNYNNDDGGGGDSDSRSDEGLMGGIDIFSSNGEGLSFPFGRIVPFGKDVSVAVSDPWSAMDVLTKGRWLVLGDGDGDGGNSDTISTTSSSTRTISEDDEFLRMGSVGDFIAIASSSAVTVGNSLTTTSDSGLILPTAAGIAGTAETIVSKNLQYSDDDDTTTETSSDDVGGIAVPCRHKSSLMAFASIHQSTVTTSTPLTLAAASTSTTTTTPTISDSGILIQSTVSEQDDSNYDSAELPTAIILPFDVDLWEMAFMLYG